MTDYIRAVTGGLVFIGAVLLARRAVAADIKAKEDTMVDVKKTAHIAFPGAKTRGERNNNPGNIRFDARWSWKGQIGADDAGYLIFDTPENGIRAMTKDIQTKYQRGLNTVRKIIEVYAPPDENPTSGYVAHVAADMGVKPDAVLDLTNKTLLTSMILAMIRFENGRVIYDGATIQKGIMSA